MAKLWCLLAMEELHVSAYSGHLQVLTTFLLKEFYIICLNRVMLRSQYGKLHVSAYSGHLQVLTTFLLKGFYIICLNRVVMLI